MINEVAFSKHITFQKGCYLDTTTINETGVVSVSSSKITDEGWNYEYSNCIDLLIEHVKNGDNKSNFIFYKNLAEKNKLLNIFEQSISHNESWLTVDSEGFDIDSVDWEELNISDIAKPIDDFIFVFSNLFDSNEVSSEVIESFNEQYTKSLESEKKPNLCDVRHLTAYVNKEPVAIASIYFDKDIACLYNVGTLHNKTKCGYGKKISKSAVNLAFSLGVKSVFLQCESSGFVEKLYRSIGFCSISSEAGFIELK
ncbi:MAG: GNAT family N-acetyltransferase [Colwellia sp.]|nr:GNAT family N-acetyltransferase [Colwellia sp.]